MIVTECGVPNDTAIKFDGPHGFIALVEFLKRKGLKLPSHAFSDFPQQRGVGLSIFYALHKTETRTAVLAQNTRSTEHRPMVTSSPGPLQSG